MVDWTRFIPSKKKPDPSVTAKKPLREAQNHLAEKRLALERLVEQMQEARQDG